MRVLLALALCVAPAHGFLARPANTRGAAIRLSSSSQSSEKPAYIESPPTTAVVEVEPEPAQPPPVDAEFAEERREALKASLLQLAAVTSRGEAASAADLESARMLASSLEALNPTPNPAAAFPAVAGTWELALCDTQLFRSSPFFMAGRAVCADGAEAEQYDWFCDMHRGALAISTIGKVRQIVSSTRLVSEFEVRAGAVPGAAGAIPLLNSFEALPFVVEGAIVSTADLETVSGGGGGDAASASASAWELYCDTVEIKGSNIPGVRQALDQGVRLPTRALGEQIARVNTAYSDPRPRFTVSYLDDNLRISRDQDDKLFVYCRTSSSTEPTDYGDRKSDLGASAIFLGFARAFGFGQE